MDTGIILEYNGITLYADDITVICDDYINSLPEQSMIYKSTVFSGMLDSIYKRCIKNVIPEKYNLDFTLLDNIFNNIYIPLCYRYNKVPTIIQFCVLVNIDNGNISDLKNGVYRNGYKANTATTQTVKKWYSVCESALLDKAISESSIGSIFALKANFGYRDNQTITLETQSQIPHETAEQIAAKHASAILPEKPILDE